MIDPNAAMLAWLQSNAALTALVDPGNFFAPVLAEGFSALADTSPTTISCAVVVRRIGGMRQPEILGVIEPIFVVEAWSAEAAVSSQIFGVISDILHGADSVDLGSSGYVISSQEIVSPQDVADPESHWFMVFAHYHVRLRSGTTEN